MVLTRSQSRRAAEDDQQDRDRDFDPPAVGPPRGDIYSLVSLTTPTEQDEYGSSTRTSRDLLSSIGTTPLGPSVGDTSPRAYTEGSADPTLYDVPEPSSRRVGHRPSVVPAPWSAA